MNMKKTCITNKHKKLCIGILIFSIANFAMPAFLAAQLPEDELDAPPTLPSANPAIQEKFPIGRRNVQRMKKPLIEMQDKDICPRMDMRPEGFLSEKIRTFFLETSIEEFIRLKELATQDQEKFRSEIERKFHEKHRFSAEDPQLFQELVEEFRNAKDENSKEKALEKLKKALKEEFDKKMEFNQNRIRQAEKKLQQLKKKFQEREKRCDEIINEKMRELTRDPILNW